MTARRNSDQTDNHDNIDDNGTSKEKTEGVFLTFSNCDVWCWWTKHMSHRNC